MRGNFGHSSLSSSEDETGFAFNTQSRGAIDLAGTQAGSDSSGRRAGPLLCAGIRRPGFSEVVAFGLGFGVWLVWMCPVNFVTRTSGRPEAPEGARNHGIARNNMFVVLSMACLLLAL